MKLSDKTLKILQNFTTINQSLAFKEGRKLRTISVMKNVLAEADNTFGEGFDWETAPWFDANGLNDVAPISKKTVAQKLQEVG